MCNIICAAKRPSHMRNSPKLWRTSSTCRFDEPTFRPLHPRRILRHGRKKRYAALAQMAGDCGATHIVTAHHGDDQLETILMRLLRGTSVTGLRGIAWVKSCKFQVASSTFAAAGSSSDQSPLETRNLKLVRPMLGVTRADVHALLDAIGQAWCEDHTNADITRDRARLRHEVLPVLQDMRPDVATHAVRLADHARAAHRLVQHDVQQQYARLVQRSADGLALDRRKASQLPRLVLTGLLRHMLHETGVPSDRLTRRGVTPIVRAVRDGAGGERWFDLRGGVRVKIEAKRVVTMPASSQR